MSDTALGFGKLTRVTISAITFLKWEAKRRTEDKCISEHDNVRKKNKTGLENGIYEWLDWVCRYLIDILDTSW